MRTCFGFFLYNVRAQSLCRKKQKATTNYTMIHVLIEKQCCLLLKGDWLGLPES